MESEQTLLSAISQITALDAGAMDAARKRQAELAKPPGSLGLLEDISVQLAGITGSVKNTIQKTRIYVLAADNGVVDEGVSSAPQSVTLAQSINLTRGLTGASCLAKHFGDELVVVDMGIRLPYHCPEIVNRSLGKGTANIAAGPAMARQTAVRGILTGMGLAAQAKRDGIQILGVGEMGIGNTTASTAMACALLCCSPEDITGRGAGLSDAGLQRKKAAIQRALSINRPNADDALDVLAKVGGFEIAGMVGIFLGGLRHHLPIIIDGVISAVAALTAVRIDSASKSAMLPSHMSHEPAMVRIMSELGMSPIIHADMALGEGTGAVSLIPLLDMALKVYHGPHTFDELGISAYEPQEGKA